MAGRKFASTNLTGTVWNPIMTGQPGFDTTATVHFSNHTQGDVRISLALTTSVSANIPNQDVFYFNQIVFAEDSRAFLGIVVEEGLTLAARSSSAGVTVLAYGFEELQN